MALISIRPSGAARVAVITGICLAVLIAVSWRGPQNPPKQQGANREAHAPDTQHDTSKTFWERTRGDPIAFYTFVLALFTGLLVAVTATQIAFLIRADKTARLSADAARLSADAGILAQRPWLKFDEVSLVPDFTIDKDGLHGSIRLVVRNAGSSPAIRVRVTAVLTAPVIGGTANPPEIALKEAEALNERWRIAKLPSPAPTLFPGDQHEVTHGFQLEPHRMADALRNAEPPDHIMVFLGCSVVYEFAGGVGRTALGTLLFESPSGTMLIHVAPRTFKMALAQPRGGWLEYAT